MMVGSKCPVLNASLISIAIMSLKDTKVQNQIDCQEHACTDARMVATRGGPGAG